MNHEWITNYAASHSAPAEPSADMREAANALRQMYVALTDQGFTVPESLQIIGYTIAAQIGGGSNG